MNANVAIPATEPNMVEDFKVEGFNEEQRARLATELATETATREGLQIASRGSLKATYKQAMWFLELLAPQTFSPGVRLLDNITETLLAQQCREKAHSYSLMHNCLVTPIEYVEAKIKELEAEIAANPDANFAKTQLEQMVAVRNEIRPRAFNEHELLFREVFQVERELPLSKEGKDYRTFDIDGKRAFRIRILHPNLPEIKTGADLIYEHHSIKNKTARIAVVQFKMWDGKSFHQDAEVQRQLTKLEKFTCNNRLCQLPHDGKRSYRLPACAAFLRPTNRIQDPQSRNSSVGLHVPICVVANAWEKNQNQGLSLRKSNIIDRSLSQRTFEPLFNNRMVGSKEIPWSTLEETYYEHRILESDDTVKVHIQEFPLPIL